MHVSFVVVFMIELQSKGARIFDIRRDNFGVPSVLPFIGVDLFNVLLSPTG